MLCVELTHINGMCIVGVLTQYGDRSVESAVLPACRCSTCRVYSVFGG